MSIPSISRAAIAALVFISGSAVATGTLSAQPVSLAEPAVVSPLPKLSAGTRIRVWTDAVWQLRVLSSPPEFYEGTLTRWNRDSLTFELNEPVATVAGIGLGHMQSENTVPLSRLSRLDRQRLGTSQRRLGAAVAVGALAGGLVAMGSARCGDVECTAGQRAVGGTVVFAVVTPLIAIRRYWEEIPLPGR